MDLNIICNGFDLYHGLPSSYYYFGCYLIKKDKEFYGKLCDAYNSNYRIYKDPFDQEDFNYGVKNIFWSNFENYLGEIDEYYFLDTTIDDLGLENDYPVDLDVNIDVIANKLVEYFIQWVQDTLDVISNYRIINESDIINDNIKFLDNDKFIVFNYTHTLQNIYNIEDINIHYIHGECLHDGSALIVGHGNVNRIKELKEHIHELEQGYYANQAKLNRINENESLLRLLEELKKDVSFCAYECNQFLSKINGNIEKINVYGSSLGEVDIYYFELIRNRYPNARWRFSYYSENDFLRITDVADNMLNLNISDYDMFQFVNPLANHIKDRIVSELNIETYDEIHS